MIEKTWQRWGKSYENNLLLVHTAVLLWKEIHMYRVYSYPKYGVCKRKNMVANALLMFSL